MRSTCSLILPQCVLDAFFIHAIWLCHLFCSSFFHHIGHHLLSHPFSFACTPPPPPPRSPSSKRTKERQCYTASRQLTMSWISSLLRMSWDPITWKKKKPNYPRAFSTSRSQSSLSPLTSNMDFSIVVIWFLATFSISSSNCKETGDKSIESHEKGDSFFSQRDESDSQTCRKHGTCEVRL